MTTHRSLNKLERKAHMNIHFIKDVAEDEEAKVKLHYTRDRLGKKHEIEVHERPRKK